MRVLITGGAGYIGSVLTRQLLDKGYYVSVFDNLQFGGEAVIDLLQNKKFQLIHGDVRDKKGVRVALKNIDYVINLAALVGEPACNIDPVATEEINHKASRMVCNLAKENGIKRFIHISTCSNYGISDTKHPATEDSPLLPISLYAETKISAEKYVIHQSNSNFSVCVLRLATVYGLSPRMRFDLLVNEFVKDAFLTSCISMYQPLAWRPFIHISDVARAIITCLNASRNKITGEVFNVVHSNYQKKDISRSLKKYIPNCKEKTMDKTPDKRDYNVSDEKIKKVLGFRAKVSLDMGIIEMLSALKSGIFKSPNDYRYTNVNWPVELNKTKT